MRFGRASSVSLLGRNGYGIVYLADQRELVEQRMALKVVKTVALMNHGVFS